MNIRCTEAVLLAFGITGVTPIYGTGVIEALVNNGYQCTLIEDHPKTLRNFMRDKRFQEGDYYLCSSGHAMALRNGVLTDTDKSRGDLKRLLLVFQITR